MPLGSFWAIQVLKIPLIKKNMKHSQTERVKKTLIKWIILRTNKCGDNGNKMRTSFKTLVSKNAAAMAI